MVFVLSSRQQSAAQQYAAQQAFAGAHAEAMRARGADVTARRDIGIERAEEYRLAQQTAAAHQQLAYQQSVVMAREQAEEVRAAQMMQAAQSARAQVHQEEQVGAVQVWWANTRMYPMFIDADALH